MTFQRSIIYQEKVNKITSTSEQSQTCINTQILQQEYRHTKLSYPKIKMCMV